MFRLFICLLFLITTPIFGQRTLQEKVAILFEVAPNKVLQEKLTIELENYCKELSKYDKFSEKKRVKKIFIETKKRFLKDYSLYSFFPDLSETGYYNCVTGSALFAIIFEELAIPYAVVEIPQHVYIVAYPNDLRIGVESTNLKDGIYQWSEYSKIRAVSYLIAIGKVTEDEVKVRGADEIINHFYYSYNELTFDDLIGIHFFNRALYHNKSKANVEALEAAQSARDFYPNDRNTYLLGGLLQESIANSDFEDVIIVDYITQYYELTQKKSERDRMESVFKYVLQEALFTRRDFEFVQLSMTLIDHNLTDQTDKNLFLSNLELLYANWYLTQNDPKNALIKVKSGYSHNPKNFQFHDLLSSLLINKTINEEPSEESFKDSLALFETNYPFLKEDNNFNKFAILYYTYGISDAFFDDNKITGDRLLEQLNLFLKRTEVMDDQELIVEIAEMYGDVGAYYYREKKYAESIEWIEKGLGLDKKNESLIEKRDYILPKVR